ncbi:MAG: hypothetical protein APF76_09235 [Desulfitibacter sp. BRH_c19]|nr:MAG: hypothetical protein APF76_09235 [Desulfitibacter sp. BRH_c19]
MQKPRIVIIDDNKELLMLLCDFLDMESKYTVIGLEGISNIYELSVLKPSLILLDLYMPTLSGHEIMELKCGIPEIADVPVILITGSKERAKQETLNMAKIVLEKPISLDELDYSISLLI